MLGVGHALGQSHSKASKYCVHPQDDDNEPCMDRINTVSIDPNGTRFQYDKAQYRDKIWIIFFCGHLAIVFGIIGWLGKNGLGKIIDLTDSNKLTPIYVFPVRETLYGLIFAIFVSCIFGAFWLHIMITYRTKILLEIYAMCIVVISIASLFLNPQISIFFIISLIMFGMWFCLVRDRIHFTEVILKSATQSLHDRSATIFVAFLVAFLEIIWIIIWSFSAMSIYAYNPGENFRDQVSMSSVFFFLLFVSLFWTFEVLKNVSHVTTAGTVAMWWFQPESPFPTIYALKRALTTSFGSICLGSLIVSVIKAARQIVRNAKNAARQSDSDGTACLLACADCLLDCIEGLLEYFNLYAYTYVAIYGLDFMTAAKNTMELFRSKGINVMINDDLSGMILNFGCFLGAVITSAMTWAFSLLWNGTYAWVTGMAVAGLIIGLSVIAVIMNVVQSAIATTFVCWAEDSAILAENRPFYGNQLTNAAKNHHERTSSLE